MLADGIEFKKQDVYEKLIVQGRTMGFEEVAWLLGWIDEQPKWSRQRIVKELCQNWGWMVAQGRLKDFSARSLRLKLEGLGRDVGYLLFGAARDQRLGWSLDQRSSQLGRITNPIRFLILPWVRVPHLASPLLGAVARWLGRDWPARSGHGLNWLESFMDRERFRGSCYRATNGQCVGQTRGRNWLDRDGELQVPVKAVNLYELRRRVRP